MSQKCHLAKTFYYLCSKSLHQITENSSVSSADKQTVKQAGNYTALLAIVAFYLPHTTGIHRNAWTAEALISQDQFHSVCEAFSAIPRLKQE